MMNNKKINIDPEKFAYHFIDSIAVPNEKDQMEKNAKNKLVGFLTAYYLINNFNQMENGMFDQVKAKKVENMSYKELLEEVSKLTYF
ncbi:hypothetical protein ACPBEH_03025 [Latilactobacillus sp. 5-91]|uniref:Uncharacterized protein n=2 Tax=Latilactobacillus sakei TaxID=1599 RepID=A0AAF0GSZ6_LATSK|nr:hypothetical protein [Latilactobacillus sakei]EOR85051.1 hypothetical protein LS25_0847 [Latilactobacillus sakei subsp. sakei LS25]MDB1552701.1 hypothetical protein [Latilactobacillus sakei]USS39437.1 hypothetical protein NC516_04230 [Latilactobacillus sakei]WGI19974.1 hypothetical protein QBD03_04495 [Latilactobacillus sakei]